MPGAGSQRIQGTVSGSWDTTLQATGHQRGVPEPGQGVGYQDLILRTDTSLYTTATACAPGVASLSQGGGCRDGEERVDFRLP